MTEQLRELLEHAAGPVDSQPDVNGAWTRGRRLRRRRQLAVASSITAVVLVGALAAIIATNHTANPSPNVATRPSTPTSAVATTTPPTSSPSSTPTTKAPATVTPTTKPGAAIDISGLSISDMSWISPTQGFALGIATPCISASRCPQILMKTTDGGAHWTGVATTKRPAGCAFACAAPDQTTTEENIRFATEEVGYAFGSTDQAFMMTTDGGATWAAQTGPFVEALAVEGTTVIRMSYAHAGCPGPCNEGVETSTAGSTTWRAVSFTSPDMGYGAQLVRSGADVYAAFGGHTAGGADSATTDLIVSHDGGSTWTAKGEPCAVSTTVENDSVAIAAAPGGIVAALCVPRGSNGNGEFVVISHDGADTFGPAQLLPDGVSADTIAITSTQHVFVGMLSGGEPGSNSGRLYASLDGGAHWKLAISEGPIHHGEPPPGREDLIDFSTATDGHWLGYNQTLWTTTDGGATWAPHAIG